MTAEQEVPVTIPQPVTDVPTETPTEVPDDDDDIDSLNTPASAATPVFFTMAVLAVAVLVNMA